ncbi:MAG: hypothetical protein WC942_04960 [Clostridia bacterium]|jgi:hypothetical protein
MKLREAYRMFDIYLDKAASESYPEILPSEKDVIFNSAIDKLIKTRYGKNNVYKAGFEEIQKRTDELNVLVKTEFPAITIVPFLDNTYRIDINNRYTDSNRTTLSTEIYYFYLKSRATINNSICGNRNVECKLIQQDDIARVIRDPFNKPTKDKILIYFEDNAIYAICADTFVLTDFNLTFLKQPRKVSVNVSDATGNSDIEFDLPESLHIDIVKLAVDETLDIIESQRKQQFNNSLNNIE